MKRSVAALCSPGAEKNREDPEAGFGVFPV